MRQLVSGRGLDRVPKLGLRESDARHRRWRDSARSEMQKISAGKFHVSPSGRAIRCGRLSGSSVLLFPKVVEEQCRLLAPFDGSPRCNVAVAIGGEPDIQLVARGDHIGANDPSATLARNFCCDAQRRSSATAW